VQIATIWVTLQAAQARRRLRQATTAILVVSAAVGVLNLFLSRGAAGDGVMAVVSGLLYVPHRASSSATWCCDGPWTPRPCWARSPPI
jgi:hypothetical protein